MGRGRQAEDGRPDLEQHLEAVPQGAAVAVRLGIDLRLADLRPADRQGGQMVAVATAVGRHVKTKLRRPEGRQRGFRRVCG